MVDYIEKVNDIAIGGYQFDGKRDDTVTTLNNGSTFTMAAGATKTFDVSSLLPNDGYDYMCTFDGYLYTGTTSGNTADMQISSGSSSNGVFYRRLCRAVTRHSSSQFAAGTIEIPVLRSDRKVTIYNGDGSGTSGNMQFRFTSYRRIGKINSLQNGVEKVTTSGGTYTFGGKVVNGNYKLIMANVSSSLAVPAETTKTIDISSVLPNDGYEYEVMVTTYGTTGTTSGKSSIIFLNGKRCAGVVTRSGAAYELGGNAYIKVDTGRKISIYNSGNQQATMTTRVLHARRIGNNSPSGTYHSYECIPSSTLQPNVLVYGSPTISNGVISGFSDTKYVEIPYGRVDGEYVVKFTMPTTTLAKAQPILHSEYWLCLLVTANSYGIFCYNRGSNTNVSLFTATAGQTYWVKLQKSGTSVSCYYSTDGEQYTSCGNFTDSSVSSSLNYKTLLGFGSSMASGNYFLGSIDLNGCYIKVNGEKVWEGMSYSKLLPIGGNGFDGDWVSTNGYVTAWTGTYTANQEITNIEVANYLPDNIYTYEVLVCGFARTSTTSGSNANLWVRGNVGTSTVAYSYTRTRTASSYADAKSGVILCKQDSNGKFKLYTNNSSSATGNCGILLGGYRRIGTNGG